MTMTEIPDTVVATLRKVRNTLVLYGDNHASKQPPQPDKAAVNYALAAELNTVLLALTREPPQRPVRQSDRNSRPARDRLEAFIETLGDRDDESYVNYYAMLGDLRALTVDS